MRIKNLFPFITLSRSRSTSTLLNCTPLFPSSSSFLPQLVQSNLGPSSTSAQLDQSSLGSSMSTLALAGSVQPWLVLPLTPVVSVTSARLITYLDSVYVWLYDAKLPSAWCHVTEPYWCSITSWTIDNSRRWWSHRWLHIEWPRHTPWPWWYPRPRWVIAWLTGWLVCFPWLPIWSQSHRWLLRRAICPRHQWLDSDSNSQSLMDESLTILLTDPCLYLHQLTDLLTDSSLSSLTDHYARLLIQTLLWIILIISTTHLYISQALGTMSP